MNREPDLDLDDPEKCEHEFDPDEGYMCLNCGAEGFEEVAASAFELAKGD